MLDRKRALVLTADAGLGHRSSANAVRDALRDRYDPHIEVEVANPLDDPRTPAWLRQSQSNYDRMARETPELYKAGYDLSDGKGLSRVLENAMSIILYRSLRDCVDRFGPDVIVSTYPLYQAGLSAVFTITRTFIPLITVVTDLASVHRLWWSDASDLTVVATARVRELAIEAGLSAEAVQILGIPVNPEFARETRSRASVRQSLGWRTDRTTILAVGGRRTGRLAELLHILNHSGLRLQICAATGGDEDLRQVLASAEWHVPVHIYGSVVKMPTMMRAADIILCKPGGLVVSESLASGLPMLLTDPIPGQEEGNADYVIGTGAAELAGDPIHTLETVCHWLEDGKSRLKAVAKRARALGRPRAAYDTASRAWAYAQRGPQTRDSSQIVGLQRLIELFRRSKVSPDD